MQFRFLGLHASGNIKKAWQQISKEKKKLKISCYQKNSKKKTNKYANQQIQSIINLCSTQDRTVLFQVASAYSYVRTNKCNETFMIKNTLRYIYLIKETPIKSQELLQDKSSTKNYIISTTKIERK